MYRKEGRYPMKIKRFLALTVTALMLLTSLTLPGPLSVTREAEALSEVCFDAVSEGPAEKYFYDHGQCGLNLFWEFFSDTGTLTITGSGDMYGDYNDSTNPMPWVDYGFADKIKSIVLPKGLTSIGAFAFSGCTALTGIEIPGKVKIIGEEAFYGCTNLTTVTLSKSVKTIDWYAFSHCDALLRVDYGGKADDKVKMTIKDGNRELLDALWTYKSPNAKPLAIKTQPKDIKADEGKWVTFTVKAVGATSIKWEYLEYGDDPNVEGNWQNAGVTSASCSVLATGDMDGYLYRCKVSNGATTLISSMAKLTVKQVKLAIKTQPKTIKTTEGKAFTLSVKATGASIYKWQYQESYDDPDDNSDWEDICTTSEDYLTLVAHGRNSGRKYRCIVINDRFESVTSKWVTLIVNVTIKKQPKSVTVFEGEAAAFSIDAPGATDYYWEYKVPGYNGWYSLDWYEPSFSLSGLDIYDSGISFRCWAYNETGEKVSSTAKLTVKRAESIIRGQYRALLIGENKYGGGSDLYGCINDMSAMAGMLRGLKKTKFAAKTMPNSNKSAIMTAISTTFAFTDDNSVSVFYYSGHGSSSGAICPVSGGNITFSELAAKLSTIGGRVIVILDSCYSGASIDKAGGGSGDADAALRAYNQAAIDAFSGYYLEPAEKNGELKQPKFIVITAASKSETSWDGSYDGSGLGQGEFTAAVIQAMGCTYPNGAYSGSMPADRNNDGAITLGELYAFVYDTAVYWDGSQHAQYYGDLDEVLFRRK